tara:strand:- start:3127 stop:3804 length:678 start_codon:yes stop_codon:yes gene_type:complete
MVEKVREDVAQRTFFEAWGDLLIEYAQTKTGVGGGIPAEVLAGLRDLRPEEVWPNREQRGTHFYNKFGSGNDTYHVNMRNGKPIGSWGIVDYGEFYGGGGAFTMQGNHFSLLDEVEIDDKKIDLRGGVSEIAQGVISDYLDKPIIITSAKKNPIFTDYLKNNFGFKNIGDIDSLKLSPQNKSRLKRFTNVNMVIRMPGPIKKSFARFWNHNIARSHDWQNILKRR